jgi:hypothetical protein
VRLPNGFMPARQGLRGAFGLPSPRSRLPCSQGTAVMSDASHRAPDLPLPSLQKLVGTASARKHTPKPHPSETFARSSLPQGTALSVALSGAGSEVLVAFAFRWAGAASSQPSPPQPRQNHR